jgi:serine protease AprX
MRRWLCAFVAVMLLVVGGSLSAAAPAMATDPAPSDQPSAEPTPSDQPTAEPTPTDQPSVEPSPTDATTPDPIPTDEPSADPTSSDPAVDPLPSVDPNADPDAPYVAAEDPNSLYATTAYTGVTDWWHAGYTGAGVDVAIIDTGVVPVEGLATPGKIVYGPDLSLESQDPNLRNLDTNGHGTFLAGIVAGHGSAAGSGAAAGDATNFLGVAPDARILSVKVGATDGSVDVSQVIAAIDWVVQHRNDGDLNVRVLLLAYGTNSTQRASVDPLAFAVEQAWRAGIFVVAATGNEGYVARTGTLTNPALDPRIFAVGASDSNGTATTADDSVPAFSSTGSDTRSVDVVAPGAHIASLRVPGSFIDEMYGSTGKVNDSFFRGSGTSEASAFVAGAAALVVQQRPWITPYQLKQLFANNATYLAGSAAEQQGHGEVNMGAMLGAPTPSSISSWRLNWSIGSGTLEGARGSAHLTDGTKELRGEIDIFGHEFVSNRMALYEWLQGSWRGGTWNGNAWAGTGWIDSAWSGNTWSGNTWSGNTWSGNTWSGNTWSGNTWSGSTWSRRWNGNTWSGNTWSGNTWSGNTWSGNTWSSRAWLGATWH